MAAVVFEPTEHLVKPSTENKTLDVEALETEILLAQQADPALVAARQETERNPNSSPHLVK